MVWIKVDFQCHIVELSAAVYLFLYSIPVNRAIVRQQMRVAIAKIII